MSLSLSNSKNIKSLIKQNQSLDNSTKNGMAHAAMLGFGETYLNPFAVFLNGTGFQIGLLASLPLLVGSIFQTLGVWLTEKFSSRLKIILYITFFQSIVWLPIAFVPYISNNSQTQVWILITLAIIYQVSGSIASPAWNSLIGDLVPVEIRGSYFGYRNRQIALATFVSLIMAGIILHLFEIKNYTMYGYMLIFLFAMFARLLSVKYIKKYQDLPYRINATDRFSFIQFLLRSPRSNYARFVFFFACMNFSAYIAGPFFAAYLLNDVKISYFDYTFIIAAVMTTQFMAMQYWGQLTDQFGNRMIMKTCGIGVTILPFFWLFSANFYVIILIQAFAGFVWAGFNLAAANFMFDAVSPPKRTRCVAYQSIINSAFICLGALLGSFLADAFTNFEISLSLFNTPKSAYLNVFAFSGACRILVLIGMLRLFKEVRAVENIGQRELIFRITSLRPLSGVSYGIVTGLLKKREK